MPLTLIKELQTKIVSNLLNEMEYRDIETFIDNDTSRIVAAGQGVGSNCAIALANAINSIKDNSINKEVDIKDIDTFLIEFTIPKNQEQNVKKIMKAFFDKTDADTLYTTYINNSLGCICNMVCRKAINTI